MSREFWSRSFPQKRDSSTISEFHKIADGNNLPDKNTDSAESTDDIANETAKYTSPGTMLPVGGASTEKKNTEKSHKIAQPKGAQPKGAGAAPLVQTRTGQARAPQGGAAGGAARARP